MDIKQYNIAPKLKLTSVTATEDDISTLICSQNQVTHDLSKPFFPDRLILMTTHLINKLSR